MVNKILFTIILIILNVCFNACENKDENTIQAIDYYQEKNISFGKDLELCIVLPEVGCGGCIDSGVFFFKANKEAFSKNQKKHLIVFTAVKSKKMLLRSLEVSSLGDYNCILDEKNDYLIDGNNSIYPLVLFLKDGAIYKAEYQSPNSEDVFGKLELGNDER